MNTEFWMLKMNIKNKKLNITKKAIYMATNPHSETLGYFFFITNIPQWHKLCASQLYHVCSTPLIIYILFMIYNLTKIIKVTGRALAERSYSKWE